MTRLWLVVVVMLSLVTAVGAAVQKTDNMRDSAMKVYVLPEWDVGEGAELTYKAHVRDRFAATFVIVVPEGTVLAQMNGGFFWQHPVLAKSVAVAPNGTLLKAEVALQVTKMSGQLESGTITLGGKTYQLTSDTRVETPANTQAVWQLMKPLGLKLAQ